MVSIKVIRTFCADIWCIYINRFQPVYKVFFPYQAVAPFIDYTDANFDFLDNVNLGFDSFIIEETTDLFSGVGLGIGNINVGSGFNISVGVLSPVNNFANNWWLLIKKKSEIYFSLFFYFYL